MSMRVTGGTLRGRVLRSPPDRAVRPTPARVREALFSILGQNLAGRTVLDACAGAGTLGVEAGSRGASSVCFVDADPRQVALVRANAALLDGVCSWEVRRGDATTAHAVAGRWDLVLADPPYGKGLGDGILEALVTADAVADGGSVVLEIGARDPLPADRGPLRLRMERAYGDTRLCVYERLDP